MLAQKRIEDLAAEAVRNMGDVFADVDQPGRQEAMVIGCVAEAIRSALKEAEGGSGTGANRETDAAFGSALRPSGTVNRQTEVQTFWFGDNWGPLVVVVDGMTRHVYHVENVAPDGTVTARLSVHHPGGGGCGYTPEQYDLETWRKQTACSEVIWPGDVFVTAAGTELEILPATENGGLSVRVLATTPDRRWMASVNPVDLVLRARLRYRSPRPNRIVLPPR